MPSGETPDERDVSSPERYMDQPREFWQGKARTMLMAGVMSEKIL